MKSLENKKCAYPVIKKINSLKENIKKTSRYKNKVLEAAKPRANYLLDKVIPFNLFILIIGLGSLTLENCSPFFKHALPENYAWVHTAWAGILSVLAVFATLSITFMEKLIKQITSLAPYGFTELVKKDLLDKNKVTEKNTMVFSCLLVSAVFLGSGGNLFMFTTSVLYLVISIGMVIDLYIKINVDYEESELYENIVIAKLAQPLSNENKNHLLLSSIELALLEHITHQAVKGFNPRNTSTLLFLETYLTKNNYESLLFCFFHQIRHLQIEPRILFNSMKFWWQGAPRQMQPALLTESLERPFYLLEREQYIDYLSLYAEYYMEHFSFAQNCEILTYAILRASKNIIIEKQYPAFCICLKKSREVIKKMKATYRKPSEKFYSGVLSNNRELVAMLLMRMDFLRENPSEKDERNSVIKCIVDTLEFHDASNEINFLDFYATLLSDTEFTNFNAVSKIREIGSGIGYVIDLNIFNHASYVMLAWRLSRNKCLYYGEDTTLFDKSNINFHTIKNLIKIGGDDIFIDNVWNIISEGGLLEERSEFDEKKVLLTGFFNNLAISYDGYLTKKIISLPLNEELKTARQLEFSKWLSALISRENKIFSIKKSQEKSFSYQALIDKRQLIMSVDKTHYDSGFDYESRNVLVRWKKDIFMQLTEKKGLTTTSREALPNQDLITEVTSFAHSVLPKQNPDGRYFLLLPKESKILQINDDCFNIRFTLITEDNLPEIPQDLITEGKNALLYALLTIDFYIDIDDETTIYFLPDTENVDTE